MTTVKGTNLLNCGKYVRSRLLLFSASLALGYKYKVGSCLVKLWPLLVIFSAAGALAQANRGELRLSVADPSGAALLARIELDSDASHYHQSLETDLTGRLTFPLLPVSVYRLSIEQRGFAAYQAMNRALRWDNRQAPCRPSSPRSFPEHSACRQ